MTTYVEVGTVEEAVEAIASGARPVAGGTDLVVAARQGKTPLPDSLVGIHRIGELSQLEMTDSHLRLGALVTHTQIVGHPLIRSEFPGLADASAIVGSHATRANGTIGGNVMNASPAMDTGAPLLCLDAVVEFVGPGGVRQVPIGDLWTGPGSTTASEDELLVAVEIPRPHGTSSSSYVRLQYRRQMEIAVAGVGAALSFDDGGVVTSAALAVSALAPTVRRVLEAEQILVGTQCEAEAIDGAAAAVAGAVKPISDVRASAEYRTAMASVMTRRAIVAVLGRANGNGPDIPASDFTFGAV